MRWGPVAVEEGWIGVIGAPPRAHECLSRTPAASVSRLVSVLCEIELDLRRCAWASGGGWIGR